MNYLKNAPRVLLRYSRAAAGKECRVVVIREGIEEMLLVSNDYDQAQEESLRI